MVAPLNRPYEFKPLPVWGSYCNFRAAELPIQGFVAEYRHRHDKQAYDKQVHFPHHCLVLEDLGSYDYELDHQLIKDLLTLDAQGLQLVNMSVIVSSISCNLLRLHVTNSANISNLQQVFNHNFLRIFCFLEPQSNIEGAGAVPIAILKFFTQGQEQLQVDTSNWGNFLVSFEELLRK